jgi:hypothetical protein
MKVGGQVRTLAISTLREHPPVPTEDSVSHIAILDIAEGTIILSLSGNKPSFFPQPSQCPVMILIEL